MATIIRRCRTLRYPTTLTTLYLRRCHNVKCSTSWQRHVPIFGESWFIGCIVIATSITKRQHCRNLRYATSWKVMFQCWNYWRISCFVILDSYFVVLATVIRIQRLVSIRRRLQRHFYDIVATLYIRRLVPFKYTTSERRCLLYCGRDLGDLVQCGLIYAKRYIRDAAIPTP